MMHQKDFTKSPPQPQKTEHPTPQAAPVAPGFTAKQHFGLRWERWAAAELTALGWNVTTPPDYNARYDLKIGRPGTSPALHCEVKVAKRSWRRVRLGYYRPRYQWDLSGGLNADRIDFLYILIALSESTGEITPFVTPSYALGHRQHVQITSDPDRYRGKLLAIYRHAWDVVGDVYEIRRKYQFAAAGQLSLFDIAPPNGEVLQ
jgi:hypothetical protein